MAKRKGKRGKKQGPSSSWGSIQLGGFRASFPQPRIPRILGAARNLSAGRSVYPTVHLDVPIAMQKASITAGALASVFPLDLTTVTNWSTRFGSLFREYAIVGAKLELRMNNTVNPAGLVSAYLDEESNVAPTATASNDRPRLDILVQPLSTIGAYMLTWTPRDILDLDFVDVGTTFTPVWLKVFASTANNGTTATTTADILITGTLALTFRGYI